MGDDLREGYHWSWGWMQGLMMNLTVWVFVSFLAARLLLFLRAKGCEEVTLLNFGPALFATILMLVFLNAPESWSAFDCFFARHLSRNLLLMRWGLLLFVFIPCRRGRIGFVVAEDSQAGLAVWEMAGRSVPDFACDLFSALCADVIARTGQKSFG